MAAKNTDLQIMADKPDAGSRWMIAVRSRPRCPAILDVEGPMRRIRAEVSSAAGIDPSLGHV